jgi:hypothetical protein
VWLPALNFVVPSVLYLATEPSAIADFHPQNLEHAGSGSRMDHHEWNQPSRGLSSRLSADPAALRDSRAAHGRFATIGAPRGWTLQCGEAPHGAML